MYSFRRESMFSTPSDKSDKSLFQLSDQKERIRIHVLVIQRRGEKNGWIVSINR